MLNRKGISTLSLLLGATLSAAAVLHVVSYISQLTSQSRLISAKEDANRVLRDIKRELSKDFLKSYMPGADYAAAPVQAVPTASFGVAGCNGVQFVHRLQTGQIQEVKYITQCMPTVDPTFSDTVFPCQLPGHRPLIVVERKVVFPNAGATSTQVYSDYSSKVGGYTCATPDLSTADVRNIALQTGVIYASGSLPRHQKIDEYVVSRNVLGNLEYH